MTRQIRSLQDAAQAIRELQDALVEPLTRPHWDFHQRRIRNAKPSQLDYDYVVRKELKDLGIITNLTTQVESTPVVTTPAGSFFLKTFGLGINSNLQVTLDAGPRMIIPFASTLTKVYYIAKVAATGADIEFDVQFEGNTIFNTPQSIPAGDIDIHTTVDFAISDFADEDILTIDLTQIGSSVPGSGVVVLCKFEVNA